ncbi:MAG: hypothetical protein ACRDZ2_16130, partial [Ilumatobacteraceae bacterium]
VNSRRENESARRTAALEVAKAECRKRPFRDRRRPDVELLTAQHALAKVRQEGERLDTEIGALVASQHRRHSHLIAHGAEQVELEAITDVLGERVRVSVNRAVADPPSYVHKTLGPRPSDRNADRVWVSAVVAIERYRVEHDVIDRRTAIGPAPADYSEVIEWRNALDALDDARDVLVPPTASVERPHLTIESPSLGIEL